MAFLILAIILIGTGAILAAIHYLTGANKKPLEPIVKPEDAKPPLLSREKAEKNGVCCGMHAVCEKFPPADAKPEYFDDEELDAFAGRQAESYTPEEADMFRDIMLTMLPSDYPLWAKSLEIRKIEMPAEVKEEFMMLLSESFEKPQTGAATPR